MRMVVVCVVVAVCAQAAEPVVAIAPPSADSAEGFEAGLLMQAEAGAWLQAHQHQELHVKQILRALERHRIQPAQLADREVAARVRALLGAPLLVYSKLSKSGDGWTLDVSALGEKDPLPTEHVALPAALPQAIALGAHALVQAVARAEHRELDKTAPVASGAAAALAPYASCYATLIRQPISVESPTVLGAAELQAALKSCRAAVSADPNYQPAWAALGLGLALAGDDREAVKALIHVHGDQGYLPLYWLGRYWLVTRYQSPEMGLVALRQALKQFPGFLLARGYTAEHLMATGKLTEALDAWREYSTLVPRNAFVRGRMSTALARLGRHEEAIAAAKEALALDKSDRDAVLELGSRYLDAGRVADAIATLQPIADGNSRGELLLRLGWAYFDQGDLARAEGLFRRAEQTATQPSEWRTRARARADLARIDDSRGDAKGAKEAMRRALDEGAGAYLHTQRDKRIQELVAQAEKDPRPQKGPRLVKPAELSPFRLDPAGDIDLRARQFPTPPPQFELLRF